MNTIPKKYLSARHGEGAIHLMRRWIEKFGEGAIMGCLLDAYKKSNPADKAHVGTLMAMFFNLQSTEHASECACRFGIEIEPSLSVGEWILAERIRNGHNVCWLKEFSESVSHWPMLVEEFDSNKYPLVFTSESARRVLCISKEDGIYAFRTPQGAVRFMVINPMDNTALIDEEPFSGDIIDGCPLYFTETSHFVSPVFQLRVVSRLLDFVLSEVGYPTLPIKMSVVFNGYNASLINSPEYEIGGEKMSDWNNVSVYMRSDYPNDYIITSTSHFLPEDSPDCPENEVASKLIDALAATSILYSNIVKEQKMLSTSISELRNLSRKYEIFSNSRDSIDVPF